MRCLGSSRRFNDLKDGRGNAYLKPQSLTSCFDVETRIEAANRANQEDGELWRWFCLAYEEGRIRWCQSSQGWSVSMDHKHLSTEMDFDAAVRVARQRYMVGKRAKKKVAA